MSGSPKPKFTAQQTLFYDKYMELLGNKGAAYLAAVAAKYSPKTASQSASRLLNSVKGIDEVERRLDAMGMPKAEVVARISSMARADVQDFFKEETEIHYPKKLVPLQEVIDALQEEIEFEEEYAERIGLSSRKAAKGHILDDFDDEDDDDTKSLSKALKKWKAPEDPYDIFFREQQVRKDRLIRLQLQLKRNPDAKELVVGDPIEVRVQRLDLTTARDKGVLHLLKSSKPTKYGDSLELYAVDGLLRDVAKMRGLFTTKVELTDERTPRQLSDAELAEIAAGGK
jgi:phage terminase small subunit